MNDKPNIFTISLTRFALVLVFIFGMFICCWLQPFAAYLSSGFPFLDFQKVEITPEMNVQYYTKVIFHWICSLPCFAIVIIDFTNTFFVRKYGKFNFKSAKIFRAMSQILFISSVIYILGNIVFMALGWNLSPLYFDSDWISLGVMYCFIGVVGVIISMSFYASYKHTIRKIAENNAA